MVVARDRDGGAGTIAIDELQIIALAGKPSAPTAQEDRANHELTALAKATPRGTYPRAFLGEQPYWTLAGFGRDGACRLDRRGCGNRIPKGQLLDQPFGDRRRLNFRLAQCDRLAASCRQPLAGAQRPLDDAALHTQYHASRRSRWSGSLRGLCSGQHRAGPARLWLAAQNPAMAGQSSLTVPVADGRRQPDLFDRAVGERVDDRATCRGRRSAGPSSPDRRTRGGFFAGKSGARFQYRVRWNRCRLPLDAEAWRGAARRADDADRREKPDVRTPA